MMEVCVEDGSKVEISAGKVREQLDLLVEDHAFRSSRRSVAFLRYVVEQTLNGSADQLKERTIGVEVFEREPSYDTNLDHVVRTAATELRKRLAIYYGEEKHRSELRIGLVPGSYIPRFTVPACTKTGSGEAPIAVDGAIFPAQLLSPSVDRNLEFQAGTPIVTRDSRPRILRPSVAFSLASILLIFAISGYFWLRRDTPQDLF